MRLVNTTRLTAKLVVSRSPEPGGHATRMGTLVAKATFALAGERPELEVANAKPVLDADEPSELGELPCDVLPRQLPCFEVLVLGHACTTGGPQAACDVELAVDGVSRRVRVTGDRRWLPSADGHIAGAPQPFARMPMTWTRAFGGHARVHVDRDAVVEVADPVNRHGRGFDPEPQARALCKWLRAPDGFPVIEDAAALPNLVAAGVDLRTRTQVVDATCWATVPRDCGLALQPPPGWPSADSPEAAARLQQDRVALRAHPDWILPLPARPPRVRLSGMRPDGEVLAFTVPQLAVSADGNLGGTAVRLRLRPETLLLLPDERLGVLVFRASFHVAAVHTKGRALRLRVDEGWYGATPP